MRICGDHAADLGADHRRVADKGTEEDSASNAAEGRRESEAGEILDQARAPHASRRRERIC